ncbi:MAG: hypothetical protein U0798_13735 [Gemmataceae bacterium]
MQAANERDETNGKKEWRVKVNSVCQKTQNKPDNGTHHGEKASDYATVQNSLFKRKPATATFLSDGWHGPLEGWIAGSLARGIRLRATIWSRRFAVVLKRLLGTFLIRYRNDHHARRTVDRFTGHPVRNINNTVANATHGNGH